MRPTAAPMDAGCSGATHITLSDGRDSLANSDADAPPIE